MNTHGPHEALACLTGSELFGVQQSRVGVPSKLFTLVCLGITNQNGEMTSFGLTFAYALQEHPIQAVLEGSII